MDMERRVILFLILSVLVMLMFSSLMRQQQIPETQQETQPIGTPGQPAISQTARDMVTTGTQRHKDLTIARKEITEEYTTTPPADIESLPLEKEEKIRVHTHNYYITFSNLGAHPVSWLMTTTNPQNSKKISKEDLPSTDSMVELIPQWIPFTINREYPLDVTLLEYGGSIHNEFHNLPFTATKRTNADGDIVVDFLSESNKQNIRVRKIFTIPSRGYNFDLKIEVMNEGDAKMVFDHYGLGMGVIWGAGIASLEEEEKGAESRYYSAIFKQDDKVKKVTPHIDKTATYSGKIWWGGLQSRFYLAAMISSNTPFAHFSATVKEKNLIGLDREEIKQKARSLGTSEVWVSRFVLEPGQRYETAMEGFAGPKYYDVLHNTGYDLHKSLFGFLRPFCVILLKIMQVFYDITANYGWAIIMLTLLVRVLAYPLTIKGMRIQAKSMAEQRRIRPLIDELNKKYKDNPALKNKKLMELYKEHGINPLAPLRGCLPMLLQMPIFFALYILLMQSMELKGESFLWIADLSGPDKLLTFDFSLPIVGSHLNLLPILMGASQYFISRLSATGGTADPMQRQMAIIFPLFFMFILYNFPSGLILYWLVSNALQVGQQLVVNKHVKEHLSEYETADRK